MLDKVIGLSIACFFIAVSIVIVLVAIALFTCKRPDTYREQCELREGVAVHNGRHWECLK